MNAITASTSSLANVPGLVGGMVCEMVLKSSATVFDRHCD